MTSQCLAGRWVVTGSEAWTAMAGSRSMRTKPMEALRRGDRFFVALDLPGVTQEDIDVTVERNVVTVRASRAPLAQEGDEVIVDERPHGEFSRQLFLGENLDAGKLAAHLTDGVLNLESIATTTGTCTSSAAMTFRVVNYR